MKLNDLCINENAIISNLNVKDEIRKRLLDIGFVRGSKVTKVLENINMGAYNVKGSIIAIRKSDTKNIEVTKWE